HGGAGGDLRTFDLVLASILGHGVRERRDRLSRRTSQRIRRTPLMRAARIHEDLVLRVDDIDQPAPGPGEVLVRVHAAGVCGTDLHILDGMIKPDPYPMTLGHEAAGVVEVAGEGASLTPGTPVAIYN